MHRRRQALVVLVLTFMSALAGCAEEVPRADDPDAVDSTSSSASEATEDPSESSDPPSASASNERVTVPVYLAAHTPNGPRLFREFREVESDNPLAEAVALMTAG